MALVFGLLSWTHSYSQVETEVPKIITMPFSPITSMDETLMTMRDIISNIMTMARTSQRPTNSAYRTYKKESMQAVDIAFCSAVSFVVTDS